MALGHHIALGRICHVVVSSGILHSSRPIWFTLSWALDKNYLGVWQQYANARRMEGDVECEGNCSTLTNHLIVLLSVRVFLPDPSGKEYSGTDR
jgi:hypothetical protein